MPVEIGLTIAHQDGRRVIVASILDVGRRRDLERQRDQLALENTHLRSEVSALRLPRAVVADSPAARRVLAQIEPVADTTATVLLLGETGVGKEVFAEAIHNLSRRHRAMIRVSCGAIPTALIESELFGRERGAFTGALSRQIGRFEAAHGSTIFLDEIGELPLEMQVKLLRVLQERTIERLGGKQSMKVDVRVIAATNRNLEQAVEDQAFREDLYSVSTCSRSPSRRCGSGRPTSRSRLGVRRRVLAGVRQEHHLDLEGQPGGAAAIHVARQRPRTA